MDRWSAHYSAEAEHVAAERMEAATTDAMPRVPFIPPTVVPNVTPEATVTKDPSAVKDLMQEFGVCILDISDELQGEVATVVRAIGDSGAGAFSGVGDEQVFDGTDAFKEAAETIPERIFGEVGAGFLVAKSGSSLVPHDEAAQSRRSPSHCDAINSYGEKRPDYLFLMCSSQSEAGGASVLTDGFAALEGLRADPDTRWVAERLATATLEITTTHETFSPDGQPVAFASTKVVETTPAGRMQIMHSPDNLKSLDTASDEEKALDQEMLRIWKEAIEVLETKTVPFKLQPGQIAVVDNYRYFHGREFFTMEPSPRALWQKWMWSVTGQGLPFGASPESLASSGAARANPSPSVGLYEPPVATVEDTASAKL